MLLMLAWRNVLRHRRRSSLTALAIVVSFAMLIVFSGLSDGAHEVMAEMGVRMGLGHVIVEGEGYLDDPSPGRMIRDPEPIMAAVRAAGSEVAFVIPRLRTEALIQAGSANVGVMLSGVDPDVEPKVSKISAKEAIVSGEQLTPRAVSASESELPPVVIGQTVAENLGVAIGDRVTITVRPLGGEAMRTGAFVVHGIFRTGVRDVDGAWSEIRLTDAQELMNAGKGVTMVAALLRGVNDTGAVTQRLARSLAGRGVEVLPWPKVAPELYATIVLDEGGLYLMMVIVFIVVAAGILNTVLMSVLERTHEFGILLAVGANPARVIGIVLMEAALLGVVSIGVGLAVGLWGNHYFATTGASLKEIMGSGFETSGILLPERFYAVLSSAKVAWSTAIVLSLVLVGAVYPAIRAARLQPTEAMRHV